MTEQYTIKMQGTCVECRQSYCVVVVNTTKIPNLCGACYAKLEREYTEVTRHANGLKARLGL